MLIVLVGPTAVGKTEVAISLAKRIKPVRCAGHGTGGGEIICADSRQIYKYMDIGTAKPTLKQRKEVPHHLFNLIEPDKDFSVAEYKTLAEGKIFQIQNKGKIPLLVGGSGLYIKAVTNGLSLGSVGADWGKRKKLEEEAKKFGNAYLYNRLRKVDPLAADKFSVNDLRRIIRALEVYELTGKPISSFYKKSKAQGESPNVKTDSEGKYLTLFFGLTCPREQLYAKINQRVDLMIKSGLIDEVKRLLSLGYKEDLNSMQAVGYRQIASYLRGDLSLSEAVRKISQDTRRYAKRQLTWFRQDKRIFWVEVEGRRVEEVVEEIEDWKRSQEVKVLWEASPDADYPCLCESRERSGDLSH